MKIASEKNLLDLTLMSINVWEVQGLLLNPLKIGELHSFISLGSKCNLPESK